MSVHIYTYVPNIPVRGSIVYVPRQTGWDGRESGGFFRDTANVHWRVSVPIADWPDELLHKQVAAYEQAIEQRQCTMPEQRGDYVAEEWQDWESETDAKYRNEGEIARLMNTLKKIKAEIMRRGGK